MAEELSYSFGHFELLPARRALNAGGAPVKLGSRAFDVLVALVERHERVVGKNELMELAWPRLVVEDNNLNVQIVMLRKLLGPISAGPATAGANRKACSRSPWPAPSMRRGSIIALRAEGARGDEMLAFAKLFGEGERPLGGSAA